MGLFILIADWDHQYHPAHFFDHSNSDVLVPHVPPRLDIQTAALPRVSRIFRSGLLHHSDDPVGIECVVGMLIYISSQTTQPLLELVIRTFCEQNKWMKIDVTLDAYIEDVDKAYNHCIQWVGIALIVIGNILFFCKLYCCVSLSMF